MDLATIGRVVEKPSSLPGNCLTAHEAAPLVYLTPEQLTEFADAGLAPHWRVNAGQPLFKIVELKRWVKDNLTLECKGASIKFTVLPIPDYSKLQSVAHNAPVSIQHVRPLLPQPPTPQACSSGVYFLCLGPDVVYVGESIEVYRRTAQHVETKQYDRWYFTPVPRHLLKIVESRFIHLLKPKYNHDKNGRLVASSFDGSYLESQESNEWASL
jgi:hypothetical protein